MALRRVSGALIRQQREAGGRTPAQIVRAAGHKFTKGAYSSWESEHYSPTDENILTLCRVFDCTYEDISVEVTEESVAA